MGSSPDEELNQQIQNKFIRDNVKPFASQPKISMEENSIPVYKVESQKTNQEEIINFPQNNFTPITHPTHNCIDFYYSVRNCPICKHLYSKNDGIYISVIVILCITVIILLKMVYQKK